EPVLPPVPPMAPVEAGGVPATDIAPGELAVVKHLPGPGGHRDVPTRERCRRGGKVRQRGREACVRGPRVDDSVDLLVLEQVLEARSLDRGDLVPVTAGSEC